MTPASPVARRLPTLGCVLLGSAALALSACGGSGGNATAEKTATVTKAPARQARAGAGRCQAEIGDFLGSMTKLRGNLAVGLSYEQYAAQLHGVRAAYAEIPVAKLTLDCLARTGAPAEKALNQYTDAANAWGECLSETGCDTASIEAKLQGRWRVASHFLSAAR